MDKQGKTITIFLVLISILLLSLTVIAMFFFQKESEMRKRAESDLAQSRSTESKLQAELKEAKKQVFIMEEKVKEADEKINDLQADLELAEGVRDQIKKENSTLKEALETETAAKEQLRTELGSQLDEAKKHVSDLQGLLDAEKKGRAAAEEQLKALQTQAAVPDSSSMPAPAPTPTAAPSPTPAATPSGSQATPAATPVTAPSGTELTPAPVVTPSAPGPEAKSKGIDSQIPLGTIVVSQNAGPAGKILSVDKENDFIIFDLGGDDGITQGTIMSIYRGSDYLGDVKVSKVQPDMAAADFIPPFSSQKVRKNDQIVIKK